MSRLERWQVLVYLTAVAIGASLGLTMPGLQAPAGWLVWPVLAALMFFTFTQTPLRALGTAARDRRWLITALVGNFLVLPLLVFALVAGLDVFGRALAGSRLEVDALSLGLLLVLLVPCTDWFLTFVHLARGDRAAAAVITPVNLVVQLGMLPLYLALFSSGRTPVLEPGPVAAAAGVVLLPLLAATLFERFLRASPQEHLRRERLGRWPIPLLAVVMLFVAVTHVPAALAAPGVLWIGVLVCVVFLGAAVGLAWILAEIAGLGTAQRATLMCTMGTRNSFVVLPVAVALPAGWELAAAVIVVQGLIELLGMAGVARWLRGPARRGTEAGGTEVGGTEVGGVQPRD